MPNDRTGSGRYLEPPPTAELEAKRQEVVDINNQITKAVQSAVSGIQATVDPQHARIVKKLLKQIIQACEAFGANQALLNAIDAHTGGLVAEMALSDLAEPQKGT